VRRNVALVLFLALLCYILGLVTAFYFPIPAQVGALVTKLLQGKIRPFAVKRNFNEIIGYVTDRKAGPTVDGNVTYLGQYAGQTSYGLITVQVPQHHPAGSPIDPSAIKKVESIPYPAFLKFLQDQSEKPLVIWIHGYRLSFPVSTTYCAEIFFDAICVLILSLTAQ
jgi:esterase/lipase superfamily enzyme